MKKEIKRTTGEVLSDFTLMEQIYDPETQSVGFLVSDDRHIKQRKEFSDKGITYKPYKPSNILISNGIILLPSGAGKYGDLRQLLEQIKSFIHRYVDLESDFEEKYNKLKGIHLSILKRFEFGIIN